MLLLLAVLLLLVLIPFWVTSITVLSEGTGLTDLGMVE